MTAKAKGTITIEEPDGSNVGSFTMELVKPDSLRIDLKGPFGIRVGTFTLSQSKFIFYNRMDNTVIMGDPTGDRLRSFLPIQMDAHDIINALVGEFPKLDVRDTLVKFAVENGRYLLQYHSPEKTTEYSIDGDAFVVSSYRTLDFDGNEKINAGVSEIEYDEDIAAPYLIRIVSQAENRSITIVYDEITFNEPVTCSFTVPPQAKVVQR
ncbi:MAG: DUF4292 domain-containing protein [Bacteroidota bacterium]|nr:DUF4292 domain-containing protein [Bacteroidota bacterium]